MFINEADLLAYADEVGVLRLKYRDCAKIAMPDTAPRSVGKIRVMSRVRVVDFLKYGVIQRQRVNDVGVVRVNDAGLVKSPNDGGNFGLLEDFLRDE